MRVRLNVMDRNGVEHKLEMAPDGSLMEALRELDYGVTGICGGMCSCASCHVYIAASWLGKLPQQQCDEADLLAGLQFLRSNSRLSCQIQLKQEYDGLHLTLAPEE